MCLCLKCFFFFCTKKGDAKLNIVSEIYMSCVLDNKADFIIMVKQKSFIAQSWRNSKLLFVVVVKMLVQVQTVNCCLKARKQKNYIYLRDVIGKFIYSQHYYDSSQSQVLIIQKSLFF